MYRPIREQARSHKFKQLKRCHKNVVFMSSVANGARGDAVRTDAVADASKQSWLFVTVLLEPKKGEEITMKFVPTLLAAALCLGLAGQALATELTHWPAPAAKQLNAMIAANANKGNFAVFDMDNTSYRYDLEESLLPFMENKGLITRDTLDPSLKLIPFKDTADHKESLFSYYYRLCEIDDMVCYPWVAQVFSGFTLKELKGYVDELMASGKPVPSTYYEGDVVKTIEVQPPKVFTGQAELYNKLMENGIEVYVMTAASEELVRMVAADPKYGYNVKPQNVIGVTTLLKNRETGELTTARKQITADKYDEKANLGLELTPYLWTPATWMAGKQAAILTYIDQWKKPVLVGGDTPTSDGYMLFHSVDVSKGGVHLWVNRKDKYMTQLNGMMKTNAEAQAKEGLPVTADKNWVIVKPNEIQ
jgi:phosphoserine phosphatase